MDAEDPVRGAPSLDKFPLTGRNTENLFPKQGDCVYAAVNTGVNGCPSQIVTGK